MTKNKEEIMLGFTSQEQIEIQAESDKLIDEENGKQNRKNILSLFFSIMGMMTVRYLNAPFIFILIFLVIGIINIYKLVQRNN